MRYSRNLLRQGLGLGLGCLAMTLFLSSASAQGTAAGGATGAAAGGGGIGGGAIGGGGLGGGAIGGGGGGAQGGGLGANQQLGGLGQGQLSGFSGSGFTIGGGIGNSGQVGNFGPGNGYYATPRAIGFLNQPIAAGSAPIPGSTQFGSPVSNVTGGVTNFGSSIAAGGAGFGGTTAAGGVGGLGGGLGGGLAAGGVAGGGVGVAGGVGGVGAIGARAGGGLGVAGGAATTAGVAPFGTTYGTRRAPAYITTLAFRYEPKEVRALQPDLQQLINNASRLENRERITVTTEGNMVVLNGIIRAEDRPEGEREKRLAEAMIRLTPGVRRVENNLRIEIVESP